MFLGIIYIMFHVCYKYKILHHICLIERYYSKTSERIYLHNFFLLLNVYQM